MTKPKKNIPDIPSGDDRYLNEIAQTCLLDDEFMKPFFELDGRTGCRCAQLILRVITGIQDLEVTELHTQADLYSPGGHDIRLDVRIFDSKGGQHDLEGQREGTPYEILMRANYYLGMITVRSLAKGDPYVLTRERNVIFITEHDLFGDGLPVHVFPPRIEMKGKSYDTGGHIIFANASYRGDDEFGRLMHDFRCTSVADMHEGPLKELAARLKDPHSKEKGTMSGIFKVVEERGRQEGRLEGRQEGLAEGYEAGCIETRAEDQVKMTDMIRSLMNKLHLSVDEAADLLSISGSDRKILLRQIQQASPVLQ